MNDKPTDERIAEICRKENFTLSEALAAFAELRELRALVAKLPKTADGVPITPKLTRVYDICGIQRQIIMLAMMTDDECPLTASECFSTAEAAAKAREGGK